MSVTIVAAYLKTESGDGYLYLFDQVDGPEEFVELLEGSMGDELEYISEYDIEVRYSIHGASEFENALRNRIAEMEDGE